MIDLNSFEGFEYLELFNLRGLDIPSTWLEGITDIEESPNEELSNLTFKGPNKTFKFWNCINIVWKATNIKNLGKLQLCKRPKDNSTMSQLVNMNKDTLSFVSFSNFTFAPGLLEICTMLTSLKLNSLFASSTLCPLLEKMPNIENLELHGNK